MKVESSNEGLQLDTGYKGWMEAGVQTRQVFFKIDIRLFPYVSQMPLYPTKVYRTGKKSVGVVFVH